MITNSVEVVNTSSAARITCEILPGLALLPDFAKAARQNLGEEGLGSRLLYSRIAIRYGGGCVSGETDTE